MKYYVGNTDLSWYSFLKRLRPVPEDINFWQPSGNFNFKAISQGSPFLLKLKSPINKVAGLGFFMKHSNLPISIVWEIFRERNGIDSYTNFRSKIQSYRGIGNSLNDNPNIGCLVLTNPIFFNENDWIHIPENFSLNIVQGKTYSTDDYVGNEYWQQVKFVIHKYSTNNLFENITSSNLFEQSPSYNLAISKVRIGQGAFRVMVTDAYSRKCAISGERTLPVLEAAHIQPYSTSGINQTNNGLLLRSDLHKLFDNGYITITDNYIVEISRRIKLEFENGRDYYKYHGENLTSIPGNISDMPNKEFLKWHNENVFL